MNLQFYRVTFWITTDFIKSSWSKFKHAKQSEVLPLRFELFLTFVGLSNSRVSFEMLFFWCFKSLCAFLNDDNERWLAICSKSSLCKRHRCKKDNLLNHCCYFEDQMKTDEKEAGRLLLVPCQLASLIAVFVRNHDVKMEARLCGTFSIEYLATLIIVFKTLLNTQMVVALESSDHNRV